AGYAAGVLTFTGVASVADYQQLLQSVTLTSSTPGIKAVSFQVIDDQEQTSVVPAGTVVTVVGLPVAVPPLVVVSPAAAGTTGEAIVVSPIVVITDLDSAEINGATVTVADAAADDVLGWGGLPTGVTAGYAAGVLTFTGVASVADYQQLLQSVTLTSSGAGLKSVSFAVVDADGTASVVPAGTVVTVVGLPVAVPPLVVVSPAATGTTGEAIVVSPIVVITDLDSAELNGATVTVADAAADDVLGWGGLPTGVTAGYAAGVLTFTGVASVADYQQLLQSVTLTSSTPGIKAVSFQVTDDQGQASLAVGTAVTVLGLPAVATPVVLTSVVSVSYTAGSSSVAVDPGILVLDADSTIMTGATVTIANPASGDALTYGELPAGVTASLDQGTLTFNGNASVSDYQQLLRSVMFSSSASALATIKAISFQITDDQGGASIPGSVAVTVMSVPTLATPVVVTSLANLVYTAGNSAVEIDPGLLILDADSTTMSAAVVSIVGGAAAGESLSWTAQDGISGSYVDGVLTFEGNASVAVYQQLLRSVTFSTTSAALASIESISLVVTDGQGNVSTPGLVAVTIVNAPLKIAPLVTTSVANISYTAGDSAVTVDPSVSVLDLDSTALQSATVTITGGFASGDMLTFAAPSGITGVYDDVNGTLTLSGTATIALYEQALRSVQLSTDVGAPAALKTVSFAVTDAEGTASLLPGNVVVTVVAAPFNLSPLVTTLLGPIYTAGNTAVQVNPLITVIDLDSSTMTGATVQISGNFAPGADILGFTPTADITGSYDSATGVLTLSGTANTLQYQQVLQSVTFSTSGTAPTAVKTLTFTVTDAPGATSLPATALVTVTANSAPVLTAPLGGGLAILGLPLLSPLAVIIDDSSYLQGAVVTIANYQDGDELLWDAPAHIQGTYSAGTLTLTGLGTVSEYQTVLRSIRIDKAFSLITSRTITMQVQDQQGVYSNLESGSSLFLLA
ncbi:beta strand repeat-containing protein, partial [Mycolicibacterium austroafricanum]|uniref:beta strand repeat-containing protein n=1 Tax=Mycolicibacterium austroafricanum TaxID=39687 RepID=UPI001CA3336A